MNTNLTEMNVDQLRNLIAEATARLTEVKPPRKKWLLQLYRTRKVIDFGQTVVEAEDFEAARAAALASQDLPDAPIDWDLIDYEVTSFDAIEDPEESESEPDYRIGANGELEDVE